MQLIIGNFSPDDAQVLCLKLMERLDLCRREGCVNACWKFESQPSLASSVVRLVAINQTQSSITVTHQSGNAEPEYKMTTQDLPRSSAMQTRNLNGSLLEDPSLFEEVYLYFHHLQFGVCDLKSNQASAPMARIDQLEAYVNDIMRLLKADGESLPDPNARPHEY